MPQASRVPQQSPRRGCGMGQGDNAVIESLAVLAGCLGIAQRGIAPSAQARVCAERWLGGQQGC